MEMAECGAASLAMVLDYHGCSVPLVDARQACAVSRDGVSAARILRAGREFGLNARGLKLELDELDSLPLPAILHWEFNHFLVLERLGRRKAVLVDPAMGRRHVTREALGRSFTGVVLAFEPTEALPRRPYRSSSLARYFRVLAENKGALSFIALIALMLEILGLMLPALNQVLIDHVIKPDRGSWLLPLAVIVAFISIAKMVMVWLRDRVLVGLQTALDLTLLSDFVHHLMHLPLSFFQHRTTGDLMQRMEANAELRGISASIVMSALDAMLLVSYAALMLLYDARLAALALGVSLMRLGFVQWVSHRTRQASSNLFALQGRERSVVIEVLSVPEVIKALGAEPVMGARYNARMTERLNAELTLQGLENGFSSLTSVFDGASHALVLWLGGMEVVEGRMTIGVFAGFLTLQALLDAPLASIFSTFSRWIYAQAIMARVDDVFETRVEPGGSIRPDSVRGEVVFENVGFRYGPSTPWLFQNLSFRVAPGEKIAFVGRSGQGKSTIMKLLLGVLEPTEGVIRLDGVDLKDIDRTHLAARLGVVGQEPFLLDDSIEENLRLRVPDADPAEIERAAKLACIHDVIVALPGGYQTQLGEGGVRLSGGQKQRISIARALVGSPTMLLLDEATSSLDLETEAAVHGNLRGLGCTRILIAHRLATVMDADRILVIDQGGIQQEGAYAELASQPGLFRDLVQALG